MRRILISACRVESGGRWLFRGRLQVFECVHVDEPLV